MPPLKQYLMESDVQTSVRWLKAFLDTSFWDRLHEEYYNNPRIPAHSQFGACRVQCCNSELAHVIIDLDKGAQDLFMRWIQPHDCCRDYIGPNADTSRWLNTDATNAVYKAFLLTLWPMAKMVRDIFHEEKIGDRVEAVLGGIVLHQVELSYNRRTDPIDRRAWDIYHHVSVVCLAAKADWKRLGVMHFIQ